MDFVAVLEESPSAGYGPFILVTSAHSEAIGDWEGSGDAVARLRPVPVGTPITITAWSPVHYAATSRHDDPFHTPPSGATVAGRDDAVAPMATHWLARRQFTPKK